MDHMGRNWLGLYFLKVRHGVDQCKKMRNLHDLNLFNGSSRRGNGSKVEYAATLKSKLRK